MIHSTKVLITSIFLLFVSVSHAGSISYNTEGDVNFITYASDFGNYDLVWASTFDVQFYGQGCDDSMASTDYLTQFPANLPSSCNHLLAPSQPLGISDWSFYEELAIFTEQNISLNSFLLTIFNDAELTQIDSYTVSSDFKISIKDGIIEDRTYNIGDAVTQVITSSGDDVPAMMLPSYTKPELNGVSTYHNPLQLQDRISRGSLKGERTESFTYFFEQRNIYQIFSFSCRNKVVCECEAVILFHKF